MRNLSFALTTPQMRAKTKTVTRRRGDFYFRVLKPGDLVCAVEKSQGIKRGGLVRLGVIRIVSVECESLSSMTRAPLTRGLIECVREGFPGMHPDSFVEMFCEHMGGDSDQLVTRIEFEHVRCICHHAEIEHAPPGVGCHFCPCAFTRAVADGAEP